MIVNINTKKIRINGTNQMIAAYYTFAVAVVEDLKSKQYEYKNNKY